MAEEKEAVTTGEGGAIMLVMAMVIHTVAPSQCAILTNSCMTILIN